MAKPDAEELSPRSRDWRNDLPVSNRELFCQLVMAKLQGLAPEVDPQMLVEKVSTLEGHAFRSQSSLQDYMDYINRKVIGFEAARTGCVCVELPYLAIQDDRWDRDVAGATQGPRKRQGNPWNVSEEPKDVVAGPANPAQSLGNAMKGRDGSKLRAGTASTLPSKSIDSVPLHACDVVNAGQCHLELNPPRQLQEETDRVPQGVDSLQIAYEALVNHEEFMREALRQAGEIAGRGQKSSGITSKSSPVVSGTNPNIGNHRRALSGDLDIDLPVQLNLPMPPSSRRNEVGQNVAQQLPRDVTSSPGQDVHEFVAGKAVTLRDPSSSQGQDPVSPNGVPETEASRNRFNEELRGDGSGVSALLRVGNQSDVGTRPTEGARKICPRSDGQLRPSSPRADFPSTAGSDGLSSISVQPISKEAVMRECEAFEQRNPGLVLVVEEFRDLLIVSLRTPRIGHSIPTLFLYVRVNARTTTSCAFEVPLSGLSQGLEEKCEEFLRTHTALGGLDRVGSTLEDWLRTIRENNLNKASRK